MEDLSVILYLFLAMSLLLCCVSWKKYNYEREQRDRIIGINTMGTIEFNRNAVNSVNAVNAVNSVNSVNESKPPLYDDINA